MDQHGYSRSPVSSSLCVSPKSPRSGNLTSLAEQGEYLKAAAIEKQVKPTDRIAQSLTDDEKKAVYPEESIRIHDLNADLTTVNQCLDLNNDDNKIEEGPTQAALRKKYSIPQAVEMHAFRDAIDVNYQRMALTEEEISGVCHL